MGNSHFLMDLSLQYVNVFSGTLLPLIIVGSMVKHCYFCILDIVSIPSVQDRQEGLGISTKTPLFQNETSAHWSLIQENVSSILNTVCTRWIVRQYNSKSMHIKSNKAPFIHCIAQNTLIK